MLSSNTFRPCILLAASLFFLPDSVFAEVYAGRVIGPDDRPVPGARVMVQGVLMQGGMISRGESTPVQAVSDAEGRFTLDYAPPVPPGVAKEFDRRELRVLGIPPEGAAFGPGAAIIKSGDENASKNSLKLSRPDVYAGTLRDELGRPLTNVRLSVRYLSLGADVEERARFVGVPAELTEMLSTRTDDKGAFRVERMPTGGTASLQIDDPFLVLQDSNMSHRIGEPVALRAHRGGTLSGRVVDARGEPIQGASVTASWADETLREAWQRSGNAKTGADGTFRIPSLMAGTYTLAMSMHGDKPLVAHLVHDVAVEAGKDNPAPEILAMAPAWLTGTVVNARTQEPMANALVTVAKTAVSPAVTTATDADGKFKIPVVPGRLEVTARAPRQLWGSRQSAAPAPTIVEVGDDATRAVGVLPVEPGEVLRGRMIDENGATLAGQRIVVGEQPGGGGVYVSGDAQGRFSLEGVQAGVLHISTGSLQGNEWKVVSPQTVTLPTQEEVVVQLRRVQQIIAKGRVVTADGQPVVDARVRFKHEFPSEISGSIGRAWSQQILRSEADGTILFKELKPESTLTLDEVEKDGYLFVSGGNVEKRGGQYHISDIVLLPLSRRLQGAVTDANGRPVPDALVWSPRLKSRVRSDETGRFSLPAADLAIELWAAKGRAAVRLEGQGDNLTLALKEPEVVRERDLARALSLLREAENGEELNGSTARELVAALAPLDPAMALNFAQHLPKTIAEVHRRRGAWPREDEDGARRAVIQAWSWQRRGASANEARGVLAMLDEIENAPDFIAAATSLGIALAEDAAAQNLLKRAVARLDPAPELTPANAASGAVSAAHVAALAATLGADEAEEYFNLAVAVHAREPILPDLMGQALAQGPADLVRRFAASLPADVRPSLMNGLPTATRLIALNYAIPVLAPHDPEAAYELLYEAWELHERAFEGKERNFREGWIADATRAVIKSYGPQRPDLVPQLAQWVRDPWHRVSMLALGARYSKPDDARQLLAEAAALAGQRHSMRAGEPLLARLAAVAQEVDPALANDIMQGLLAARAEDERRMPTAEGEIAYYLSFVSPEEARALLETEWSRQSAIKARQEQSAVTSISSDSDLAVAMAPLDWERAVAWARSLEAQSQRYALGRLALWALQSREERTLFRGDQAP